MGSLGGARGGWQGESGGGGGAEVGGGGCVNELGGPGGAGSCELPVSREDHPAVLKAGAEPILRDVGCAGGGGCGAELGIEEDTPEGRVSDDDPTDAQPPLLLLAGRGAADGGLVDETVAHPDFLNAEGLGSPSLVATTGVRPVEATGLAILTPAAFAALLNSFSSLFLSFSFLSSAALASAAPPFAFVAISFIRAL